MKKTDHLSLKLILTGIFILLLLIAFRIYSNNKQPVTEMDCLKLGSDARATACINLLKQQSVTTVPEKDFPINYLQVENASASQKDYCIEVSGTVYNSYSKQAKDVFLKIDFSKNKNEAPFHYQTFYPFDIKGERVQPNSRKTFTECLSTQTFDAVKNLKNWYFSITPYSAKAIE